MPFVLLALQTIVFWVIVVFLYRARSKYTLVPIYSYIAILTILTHNLSDLGFSLVHGDWFFLIASVSFFTTLMFATLFLYLLEGPRAGRIALWVILGASAFYVSVVFLLSLQVDTTSWFPLNFQTVKMYFWSILAIVVDVILLAIFWELASKVKKINLLLRVFFVIFSVLAIDSFIFVSGVFITSGAYISMLKGSLLVRLVLSVLATPLVALLLKAQGFSEENRAKPKSFWEILNFRSDLEEKIINLEENIKKSRLLEEELKSAKETYELVLKGSGAGIWDWNIITNSIYWSPQVCFLLGYNVGEIKNNLDAFKALLHPDDVDKTFEIINRCLKDGLSYEVEYRLQLKSGEYKWFLANGTTKYDLNNRPVRMVGTIIDINERKTALETLKNNIEELKSLNEVLVGRELKMSELKAELMALKGNSGKN